MLSKPILQKSAEEICRGKLDSRIVSVEIDVNSSRFGISTAVDFQLGLKIFDADNFIQICEHDKCDYFSIITVHDRLRLFCNYQKAGVSYYELNMSSQKIADCGKIVDSSSFPEPIRIYPSIKFDPGFCIHKSTGGLAVF